MGANKYEALLLAVELGGITRAAEALGVTQSAVSHMISSLEEELGFALLRRSRFGAQRPAARAHGTPAIRGIVSAQERLSQTAAAVRGLERGTVRIGTFSSVGVRWLPGIIAAFRAAYPGVELKLMSGDYHDVEQWLSDGSADLGFVPLPTGLSGEITPLAEDELLAVVPESHPLAAAELFPAASFAGEDFIGLLETSDRDARGALAAAGVSPRVRYSTKDDYAVIAMVRCGLGVSIMPRLLLGPAAEGVRCLPLDPPASRTIGLCLPDGERAGPATRRFAETAREWVAAHGALAK